MFKFFRKNAKWILISVVLVFIVSVFYGLGWQTFKDRELQVEGGVAKVNGKKIDPVRFNQILNSMLLKQGGVFLPEELLTLQSLALDQTVDFTLVLKEAQKKQRVSGQELAATIDSIIKEQKFKSEDELKAVLKRNGVGYNEFKRNLKEDILVQKMVQQIRSVSLTPNDLRDVEVRHILIMPKEGLISGEGNAKKRKEKADKLARQKAEELLAQIKAGKDFAALAQQYSDDPGSRAKGGDLGYFGLGSMVPEFETVAFGLKVGEVSGVVKTPYGYHILKLENTRLKKAKGDGKNLEQELLAAKQERAFREWFYPIKQKAKVEILDPMLKANDLRFKGQFKEAIAEFLRAARLQPNNPYPYIMLGSTYTWMGEKDSSLEQYKRAVEVAPGNVYSYLSLGLAYSKLGEKQKAREAFERASVIAGDSVEQHEQLQKLFTSHGQPEQAAREKAILGQLASREKLKQQLFEGSKKNTN